MRRSRERLLSFRAVVLTAGVFLAAAPGLARAASPVDAARIASPIVVDGNVDTAWEGRLTQGISKVVLGTVSSTADLSGTFGVLWDADHLYLLVEVKDDSLRNDSAAVFDDDSVDLYLDLNHDAGTTYGADDFLFQFGHGDAVVREAKHNATTGATVASVAITGGYRLEAKIPWSTLGTAPTAGRVIGLDVFLNDDDDGAGRDGQVSWNSPDANAYLYPDRFGDCRLVTSSPGPVAGYTPAASTPTPIVIDGTAEAAWSSQVANPISKVILGTVGSAADLSGTYSVLWDNAALYLLVDINDDSLRNDSAAVFDDDSIDLYLDLNHDAGTAYGADDFLFQVGYGDTGVLEVKHNATAGVQVASVARTGGYRLEVKLPWSTLGTTPSSNRLFGLDVLVNDDDDGAGRDGQMSWNSPDANAYLYPDRFGDCQLTGTSTNPPPPPPVSRGATVPWRTYEAEDSATNGTVASTNQLGREASGGKGVTLDATGEYVEFVSEAEANRLVLRYSIPAGASGTLSLYVNGAHRLDLPVRSDKLYEPRDTKTLRFYDEVDVATTIHEGDVVRLRKDAGDTVASYTVDLVDLEWAPAPGTMPAGFLSVTAYGATPNDTTDDWTAIDSALKAGQAQGKGVWFPAGTFRQSKRLSVPAGVKVQGAGLWHTQLFGYINPPVAEESALAGLSILGNDVSISDLRLTASITTREKTRPAISNHNGAANFRVENVWIEYFNTGVWLSGNGYKGVVRSNRVRLTYADALHATYNERDTLFENNHVRGCGDDGIATVSSIPPGNSLGPATNIVARFNTIVANYWGRGMSVVGGTNILYEDNLIYDQAYAAGMLIATEPSYATYGIDGVTYRRNSIVRCGGESYIGSGHGAVTISIQRSGTQALNLNVLDNEVRNSKRSGVMLNGTQHQQTTIRYNTFIAPTTTAIEKNTTVGTFVISDNVVQ